MARADRARRNVREVDSLEGPGCEGTRVPLTHRAGPRLNLPVLGSVLKGESLPSIYSAGVKVPFNIMLTTLQSLGQGGCAIIPVSLQLRTRYFSLPTRQLVRLGHRISLELLDFPVWKYFGVHLLSAGWPASWIYYKI